MREVNLTLLKRSDRIGAELARLALLMLYYADQPKFEDNTVLTIPGTVTSEFARTLTPTDKVTCHDHWQIRSVTCI